jgi:hypothetical protein
LGKQLSPFSKILIVFYFIYFTKRTYFLAQLWQVLLYKKFSNWRKIMLLLFSNIKFWQILIFVSLKVFLYWIFIFFKIFEKKIQKIVTKFLKNRFLVLSKQSRIKLKDIRKNQNQTIAKSFLKFRTKSNPNLKELEPIATLIFTTN